MHNHLKERLRRGEIALGCAISLNSLDVVELLSQLGFDWLWFDTEHTPLDIGAVQPLMQAIRRDDVTPIVRVAWNDPVRVKKALDIGAHGVIVPWVSNAEEAEAAVRATRYPPQGIRGFGPRRASNYGLDRDYVTTANQEIMVVVQIETRGAVRHFEEILSVEGVDAYMIGPNDLASSLGYVGQPTHPEAEALIAELVERGKKAAKPGGIVTYDLPHTQKRIEQGFQLVNVGSDLLFLHQGANGLLQSLGR